MLVMQREIVTLLILIKPQYVLTVCNILPGKNNQFIGNLVYSCSWVKAQEMM